ncbi:DnaB-like helicase C-terminal domain-containing protein [Borreliella bavariensis]|uniref:DnaB-like helicase C-terminal domain-containing protein n=1 Tax=Borreliella bavariensis TaxID=664662 RepID=UPI001C029C45
MKSFRTGFESLDKILVGFKKEDFIIIGTRPSVGKTTLALNIALNIGVIKKHKVGFFSLEMSSDSLIKRSLSFFSKILYFKIQHGFLRDIGKKELD